MASSEPPSPSDQPELPRGRGREWGPKPQRPIDTGSDRAVEAVAAARALGSTEELLAHYETWAPSYDRDVFGSLRIVGPAALVRRAVKYVAAEAKVLDVGCGTGVVGSHMRASGYTTVDGLDISPAMLAVAEAKRVYRRLFVGDLTTTLDIPDGAYDAVVCAGTFVAGHVTAAALAEMCRVVGVGGLVVFNVASSFWDDGDFEQAISRLTGSGAAVVVDDEVEPITVDETQTARSVVLRIAG